MIATLERRFDAYMAGELDQSRRGSADGLVEGELPSADELAAELERFLADRPDDDFHL
jgi:hypothetical protein